MRVGLGVDFQHRKQYEFDFENLIYDLSQDLSHLSVVGLENTDQVNSFKKIVKNNKIILHLLGVSPSEIGGLNKNSLDLHKKISDKLNPIWCVEDIGLWYLSGFSIPYFSPPVLTECVLEKTINQIHILNNLINVPFLPEVPSCGFVCGNISLPEFFKILVESTGNNYLLDISHVYSYAVFTGTDPIECLLEFPLDRVREIHIAGGGINNIHPWRYMDTHNQPVPKVVLEMLEIATPKCTVLDAVTYEIGIGVTENLLSSSLKIIDEICKSTSFDPFHGFKEVGKS